MQAHEQYSAERVHAFVFDLSQPTLCEHVAPASVDVVSMLFVLSAMSPHTMQTAVNNVAQVCVLQAEI